MAFAAGGGGEEQQGLVLVEVAQYLAVHLKYAQFGGDDAFVVGAPGRDLMLAPELGELGAGVL